ncbi:TRIC cation channel family protein [Blastococcus sp. HT6-30]|uniref:trimeric intracellular cation channel family protein n=1 Tax=Blastococcus sp. HT6-30 TaxID=3144843 RepID=UPI00321AB9E7
MEILAAAETLRVPAAVDLAAIVIGALTGGLLAAREGFAVSGVLLLAVSGGLGGGLIRDVLLAEGPPVALTNQAYLPTVAITAGVTFFFSGWLARLTGLLVVLDAVTLGFFTVIGAQKAQLAGLPSASVVFIGTLTAVGGALIRDMLLAQRADIIGPGPYNAVAALIGATALTVLAGPLGLDPIPVAALVIALVAALRVLSVWRGWEAPVAVDLPGRTRSRLLRRRERIPHRRRAGAALFRRTRRG